MTSQHTTNCPFPVLDHNATATNDWADGAVYELAHSTELQRLARAACRRNRYDVRPDDLHTAAYERLRRERHKVVPDPDGFVRSRVRYAFMDLLRDAAGRVAREQRLLDQLRHLEAESIRNGTCETDDAAGDGAADDRVAVDDFRAAINARRAALGTDDVSRRRPLDVLLVLTDIAAGDIDIDGTVAHRSVRLEHAELERIAACAIVDPDLAGARTGPDPAALRQRRRRLIERARAEATSIRSELAATRSETAVAA